MTHNYLKHKIRSMRLMMKFLHSQLLSSSALTNNGIIMFISDPHPLNAILLIVVTEDGILLLVINEHSISTGTNCSYK